MKRSAAVCPKCGSTRSPVKEKIMGSDTMDLICQDCGHVGWWKDFQPSKDQNEGSGPEEG